MVILDGRVLGVVRESEAESFTTQLRILKATGREMVY